MNLYAGNLNSFFLKIRPIFDSILFNMIPTLNLQQEMNLCAFRVQQTICLKGFKSGAGLVGNERKTRSCWHSANATRLICWMQMQRLARASRLLTSSLLGQTTHFPRPSTVGNGTTPHGVGTINRLRRLGLLKWTFGMDLSFVSNVNPDPPF